MLLISALMAVQYAKAANTFLRQYELVSSKSDGTFNASTYSALAMSVSDLGDVVQSVYSCSDGQARNTVVMKHLSNGSGTLEQIQHVGNGLLHGNGGYGYISDDGRYVLAASKDGAALRLPVTDTYYSNLIRIKTGL
jgi:hypothetical protein